MKKLIVGIACVAITFMASSVMAAENWYDMVKLNGLIWADAYYKTADADDGRDGDKSDIDVARMQFAAGIQVHPQVSGYIRYRWDNDDVGLYLEDAYITLTGKENMPLYLIAGRQYIPFGNYTNHFITDPTTFILGNTNDGAAVAGYRFSEGLLDASLGLFSGGIQDAGDQDTIDSFVASVKSTPIEGLDLMLSFTSNLSSSETLHPILELNPDPSVVGGWHLFARYLLVERLTFIGEFVGATGEYDAGELAAEDRQPIAWNTEVGYMINDAWTVAARYGGSKDGGDLFPKNEFGIVANWGIFTNTNFLVEYMHGTYQDIVDKEDTITARLSLVF
ncbi:MAG: LbtU family siderophore porin [Thermodesulfobacteriota bacterium]